MNDGWRDREAPAIVEQRLMGAFRADRRKRRLGHSIAAMGVAAVLAVVLWMGLRPREVPRVAFIPPRPAPARLVKAPAVARLPVVAAVSKKGRHRRSPRPAEVATEFMPLDAAPVPVANGEVVRVEMPRATMVLFGLPVDARRAAVPIQADVLFGEDGMAHAVRFVSTASYEIPAKR